MHKKEPWEWALLAGFAVLVLLVLAGAYYSYSRERWTVTVSKEVQAAPERVFALLTSAEDRVIWQYGVTAVTPLAGENNSPDSTRMIYMRVGRQSWQIPERLQVYDPPTHWAVIQNADGFDAAIDLTVTETATGTKIVWQEERRFFDPIKRIQAWFIMRRHKMQLLRGFEQVAIILTGN